MLKPEVEGWQCWTLKKKLMMQITFYNRLDLGQVYGLGQKKQLDL